MKSGKMNAQEALARIKEHRDIHFHNELNAIYITEALDMAIEALEKHKTPKKVIENIKVHPFYDDNYNIVDSIEIITFKCPQCKTIIASGEIDTSCCTNIHYCENCGCKLDWRDTE